MPETSLAICIECQPEEATVSLVIDPKPRILERPDGKPTEHAYRIYTKQERAKHPIRGGHEIFWGNDHPNSKVTEAQAEEIQRRALAGENQRLLGEEFGISQPTVSWIKRGGRKQLAKE